MLKWLKKCPTCDGRGALDVHHFDYVEWFACDDCKGAGQTWWNWKVGYFAVAVLWIGLTVWEVLA